jgi:hypothetical protein
MLSRIAEANRAYSGSICLSALALQLALTGQCSSAHWSALSRLPGVIALIFLIYFLISATLSETDSNKDQRSTIQRWGAPGRTNTIDHARRSQIDPWEYGGF